MMTKKIKIPREFKKYFWDIDLSAADPKKQGVYILERLLEYGDSRAIKWLKDFYGLKLIKGVVAKSRKLSPKTVNYWRLVLGMA